ncbi:apolipophorins [Anthonomus grandis grandis]|uniref:apolipophorins n=1 Tax=Anthonomus grandis grandis TaxID=2921223 RepID=UPI0021650884|nr:apolipophorins [Anthonomus grandis grandis]
MKKIVFLGLLLKLLVVLNAQHANPLKDPNICGIPTCSSTEKKFHYDPDRFYTYKYSIEARSIFSGTSKNESTLFIDSTVTLNFLSHCDGIITISDTHISEINKDGFKTAKSESSNLLSNLLGRNRLRFAYRDGVIYEICPDQMEGSWALNFKRGVLSMIQNSQKRFDLDWAGDEEDVRGLCPTSYKLLGAKETSLEIRREKDLVKCVDRIRIDSIVQYTTSNFHSRTKNEDILQSSSSCLLSVDENIYNKITCKEEYVLEPFSKNAAGARTTVLQELILIETGQRTTSDESEISRRTNLKFDHSIPKQPTNGDSSTTRDLLMKLCKENQQESENFSDLFGKFVYGLRGLSYPALSSFYSHKEPTCPTAKKIILDALPYVNTAGSLGLMKDRIKAKLVPEDTLTDWMSTLAFIPNPDKEMLEAALIILKEKQYQSNVAFSVASLTHTYCTLHKDCQKTYEVQEVVKYFESELKDLMLNDILERVVQDKIIVTLKALSSIGVISENFELELFKLAADSNLDVGIRVAAIETFRRLPCEKHRSYFESMFGDQEQDTEVRIAAYLQVMRCPSYLLVRTIAYNLRNEEVNQVGSFVWSHLHNIVKSANPLKVEIQSLLSEENLISKFSSDVRKFSHNKEGSLYFDEYNVGGTYETNILFSPSSYIPRSAMLNLTVDLFGKYVNLFEVQGRMEGFERYFESLFGPGGKAEGIKEKIEEYKTRWIRAANENDRVENRVQELADNARDVKNEPKVTVGVKVFGNDLKYSSFQGDQEIKNALDQFNVFTHLKHILSGKEITYKKATMFLDSNYVVPTGSGLPLFLSALGTSSVNIKLFGSLRAAEFAKKKELDLVANFEPTAAVDVSAEMSLSAFYESTGIKLKTDMHSSIAVKGDVKVRGAKLVSVKFSLPKKTVNIFGARSELLVKQNNKDLPQGGLQTPTVSSTQCTWSAFSDAIGLTLCLDYNYKNSTQLPYAPDFMLAGPASLQLHIQKSDPTANVYLFEYKSTQNKGLGVVSLRFDTPGSEVKRLIHANFTTESSGNNLTMLMQSSAGMILAKGRIKNTDDQKIFQMTLDIDDKQHFDATIAYDRFKKVNGFLYKPRVYLGVNGERVTELQGTIDLISKKDISQYTVDLKFQTKRLTSKLFGYISKTESSIGIDLSLDYKFVNTREQRVSMTFRIANRSKKNLAKIIGDCDVQSTSYPSLNFQGNMTFQRSGNHMEFKVGLIQNPLPPNDPNSDFESLKFDFLFSHKAFTDAKQTIKAVANVKRISSNLDLKGSLFYETINSNTNMECIVNYGHNKQVSLAAFYSHPRTTLEEIKAYVNISVPTFVPMLLKVEVSEKQSKNYRLDLSGTWFSGHSAAAVGFYQDSSTSITSNHHLKLFITSPTFKDISSDLIIYRDNEEIKVDVKVTHDNNDYQFLLDHQSPLTNQLRSYIKIKYKTKLYSLNTVVTKGSHMKISSELHIDQLRDVEFSVWVFNEESQKALGFDINWDANRDPNQKLLVAANFTKAADFNYNADLIVSYPGRTIIGKYEFLLEKGHIDMLASVSWDDGKSFAINLNVKYRYENEIFFEISSRLNTPLESWKNMKLTGVFEHINQKYILDGALTWNPRQKVAINLFGDYASNETSIDCRYSCAVQSTMASIPNINTTLQHAQNGSDYNTIVHLMYNPEFLIDIDSKWQIQRNERTSNLTGTVKTITPFPGLKKTIFVSKITYDTSNKYLRGVAEVDVDHKSMLIDMEGKFRKLMDSMFVANITTPDEKYQCRFKLSKKERHFVALISYPDGNLGTEVLLVFNDLTDFDVKLLLATPVEFLENVVAVAKLKTGAAEFRIGWNSLTLGVSGLWHYVNIIDFEYAYKIYTPIRDFEENGVVARLVLKDGLDFEVSFQLSLYKLGVKLLGKPKPKPLKELGINVKEVYNTKPDLQIEEMNKTDDFLSLEGLIEIDAIFLPTMKGELEIDQKGTTLYVLQSKLSLPHGIAVIINEFEYIDILAMSNYLRITTPYKNLKEIKSDFKLRFVESKRYLFNLGLYYLNNTLPTKASILAEYNVNRQDIDERIYNVTLEVNTPFKAFPNLKLFGAFETEENFYRTKLLFTTNRSDISLDATTEIEEGWLELTSDLKFQTAIITVPRSLLRLTKRTSLNDNFVEARLNVPEKLQSEIYFRSSWLLKGVNQFRSTLELETPFTGLENTKAAVDFLSTDVRTTLSSYLQVNPIEGKVNSTFENNLLTVSSLIKFSGKVIPINVQCHIIPSNAHRTLNGTLLVTEKVFNINGDADLMGSLPVKVLITLTPNDNGPTSTFQYNLEPTLKGYTLVGSLGFANRLARFSGNATGHSKLNWEIYLQVDPPNPEQKVTLHGTAKTEINGTFIELEASTNIPKLEHPLFGLIYRDKDLVKQAKGYFKITQAEGSADIELTWLYLENMILKAVGNYKNPIYVSSSQLEMFYQNPDKSFVDVKTGGDLKIDRLWEAGANASLKLPNKSNISLEGHIKIPNDFKETHSLFGDLSYTTGLKFVDYLVKYRSTYPIRKYGLWGEVSLENKREMSGNATIEWNGEQYHNDANLKLPVENALEFGYKLKTPKYDDKQLFVADVIYGKNGEHHNVTCKTFYPEDVLLAYGTIDYAELANMFGTLNMSLPHKSLNFSGLHFKAETNRDVHNRYLQVFWANDTALLDSKCKINTDSVSSKHYAGDLVVEVPLTTRHVGVIDYEYQKNSDLSMGKATVIYNGGNVLDAKYNCLSKSEADAATDTIHVELLNKIIPIGADYVHRQENGSPRDAYIVPALDKKNLHLYHLQNQSKFNLTGEVKVKTHDNGQGFVIAATHSNRTINLSSGYSIESQKYSQRSRLELSPKVWIEYDFSLINKTVDDHFDVEMFVVNLSYPRRNVSGQAFYNVSDSIITTDILLEWDKDKKTVEAALDWRKLDLNRGQLSLVLKHPSFQKDVSLVSSYGYDNSSLDGELVIDYSPNAEQMVTVGVRASDKSSTPSYSYTYNIWAEHNATNLHLTSNGLFHYSPEMCQFEHTAEYQRSYLPLTTSLASAKVDFNLKDVSFKKHDIIGKSHFWGRYGGNYPIYTANMTAAHSVNYTAGSFYLNFAEKLLYADVNLTEDGSQSLHIHGVIPDARNVEFDVWRDYEDKRLTDVSYYLKLNHSRLIMSQLKWRPELISDVQNGIRSQAMQLYYEALDQINDTRQYVMAESMETIDAIWQDSKPIVSDFLTDLRNLAVIEDDIENLKEFLNTSYNNNDFYIKDISTVIITLIDDLSLKSHLQSLPKIFQELWTIMGASGKNLKESIKFVIEKVKSYYVNTTKFIHDLINGDPVRHLSKILEKIVDKYDDYIKNMHVATLQYIEMLWNETYELIVDNWHQVLAAMEPTFLKFIHYGETILWTTGKEFLDFLYIRKNKIIESAYFTEFTKFSRDADRFYKDITGNNTVEAIYKYGTIAWNFVNEKYINHIPFGKELKAVVLEIIAELEHLGEVPAIKYGLDKVNEVFDGVKYYYKYFEVEYRVHRFIRFLYRKVSEMSVTALEYDNRAREAKTKFVYEPNDGIMLLEEKLPMSWHGFNETPQFQEIPEMKMFYNMYNYLASSEISFWNFYYKYMPYTDPLEWLPPFKGHAMLIGGRHYVTFDKKHYEFKGSCTYLLTTDVVDRNFTLLVSYNENGVSNEVILLINRTIINIDMFKDVITVNGSEKMLLPLEIGNNYLYREAEILYLTSKSGFRLECNIKFQICVFEVTGWHFAKTAGLWGTYNNEPNDDISFPNKTKVDASDLTRFGDSWVVSQDCKTKIHLDSNQLPTREIQSLCHEFFFSKVSDLSLCFDRIPKDDFVNICMKSNTPQEACRSVIGYIEMCQRDNTPLNIPDSCIKCKLLNGTEVREGDFIRQYGNTLPRTADVVFIVEAKKCNKNLKERKNFKTVVESINQELAELNITNNRYAVVVFGGDGVFNVPRSIVSENGVFTNAISVLRHFDFLIGNGSSDIYRAITYANELVFRPEASRNFILLPCSSCEEHNMEYDYGVVHQLLFENSASLHILMDNSFSIKANEYRKRENKVTFGIDLVTAYTKKDIKKLEGDQALRNSISLSKSTLGLCSSLALETNGTIFSAKQLEIQKNAKKFATVFGKRVAYSAAPRDCTECECTSFTNGLSRMECAPCTYPRSNIEHNFFEEDEIF